MMTHKKKASKTEVYARTMYAYELLINGATRQNIHQEFARRYGLKRSRINDYIAYAHSEIKKHYDQNYKDMLIEQSLAQLDHLYQKNMEKGDYRECRHIIESRAKLLGLTITKVDITSGGAPIVWKEEKTYETHHKTNTSH